MMANPLQLSRLPCNRKIASRQGRQDSIAVSGLCSFPELIEIRNSIRQCQRRLKKWNVRKNLQNGYWKVIGRRVNKRKLHGKESELRIDGRMVPWTRGKKEIGRNFETALEMARKGECSPKTSSPHRLNCLLEVNKERRQTPEGCIISTHNDCD